MNCVFASNLCSKVFKDAIQDYTGLSEDALNTLRFIKKLNTSKIFLFILSRLIQNRDFSCNLMSEINSCFEKDYYYDNNQKLLDSLIEELRDAKDSKIYRTHIHFLNILDSFLSNRIKELNEAPDTN